MHIEEELIAQILDREPALGGTDVSKCLPGWIKSLCYRFEEGGDYTMSHNSVGALLHTLVAARLRAERLVRERDAYKEKAWRYESLQD